ncbi:MAG TPA: MFS transporter [Eubacteriaceae bacterium]|nr:MFS transporter [Eubacteriaceae bacterium]
MQNNKSTVFSIMAIFFVAMGVGTITPAIANIAAAFPEIPFTTVLLVSTLPSLLLIPSTLIAGSVAGTKIRYRTLALLGLALFSIGGIGPAFLNSTFTTVLIFRGIFGISLGIIMPLGNAIILGLYEGQARANLIGIGGFVMNIGGIVLQFLGGFFSDISWEFTFYAHFPAIISFFLVLFFLKEPKVPEAEIRERNVAKEKPPMSIWLISFIFGITMLLIYPMLVNMSSIMADVKEIGDASQAAITLAMYTVGGALAGAIFGSVYKYVPKRFIIPLALFGGAAGLAIIIYSNSFFTITLGVFIVGLFYMTSLPAVAMMIGMYSPPSANAMSMSILMAVMNAFAFVSTYWIGFITDMTGDPFIMPLVFAAVGFAIIGVLALFVNPFKEDPAPVQVPTESE